jgi:hypothetical protein
MQDFGYASGSVHGGKGTSLAGKEAPREPSGPGTGWSGVAHDAQASVVGSQRYFAEHVFFQ